jgi:hypothetical protein
MGRRRPTVRVCSVSPHYQPGLASTGLQVIDAPLRAELNYAYKKMRINSKDTVGGYPALLVRKMVRALINRVYWDLETVERILHLGPNEASGR